MFIEFSFPKVSGSKDFPKPFVLPPFPVRVPELPSRSRAPSGTLPQPRKTHDGEDDADAHDGDGGRATVTRGLREDDDLDPTQHAREANNMEMKGAPASPKTSFVSMKP